MSREPPPYPTGRNMLAGKTVVVTAAAGTGIGFSVAKRAAEEGAIVLISDLHERRLAEASARLAAETGRRPASHVCDVTKEDQVQALRDAAIGALGHVDVLVNNAGLGGTADIISIADADWSRIIDLSLTSVMRMCRAFLPLMYQRKDGAVVNNASVLGWRAQRGQAAYAAAKAGVMALTRCVALEAADYGVRVNAVAPSIAMHPFLAKVTTNDLLDTLTAREAFGRPAEVWEIANAMIFLASDLSSYMTGEVLSISSQQA